MTDWISVDERLPEKSIPVLVLHDGDETPCCVAKWWDWHDGALWHEALNGEYMIHGVTHWMPLPERPG